MSFERHKCGWVRTWDESFIQSHSFRQAQSSLYCSKMRFAHAIIVALLSQNVVSYDTSLGFNTPQVNKNRTLDEIYQAALAEGGVVTC